MAKDVDELLGLILPACLQLSQQHLNIRKENLQNWGCHSQRLPWCSRKKEAWNKSFATPKFFPYLPCSAIKKKKKKKISRTWPIDTLPDITETARKGMIIIGNSKQYRFSLTTSLTDFTNAMFPLTLSDKLFCQVAKVPLQSLMCYNLCLMFCQCLLKWCLIAVQKQTNLYQNGIPFSEICLSSK